MSVTGVNDYSTSTVNQRAAEEKASGQNSIDFLTLLVAQLTNQDPLNPMEDADFTSQLAQLEQLEQTISLNKTMSTMSTQSKLQSATAMIGMEVTGVDSAGDSVTGTVLRASQSGDLVYLELSSGKKIEVSNVTKVTGSDSSLGSELAASSNAIGMWIEAGRDAANQEIKGIVEEVVVSDGQVMLKLYGGQAVSWSQVTNMRAPTESEAWYMLPDSVRNKIEAAGEMYGMAVTGQNDKGETVTGIVASVQLSSDYTQVYVVLFDGTTLNYDNLQGKATAPKAEDVIRDLVGLKATGLDEDGNTVSGIITGAEDREGGTAVLLDNGLYLYYDALRELAVPDEGDTADTAKDDEGAGEAAEAGETVEG